MSCVQVALRITAGCGYHAFCLLVCGFGTARYTHAFSQHNVNRVLEVRRSETASKGRLQRWIVAHAHLYLQACWAFVPSVLVGGLAAHIQTLQPFKQSASYMFVLSQPCLPCNCNVNICCAFHSEADTVELLVGRKSSGCTSEATGQGKLRDSPWLSPSCRRRPRS